MTAFDELRTTAPASLIDAGLAAAGIVDGYVTRPSPLGALYVAFSPDGVVAVDIAASDDAFEERHRARGRRAVPVRRIPDRIGRHLDRAIEAGRPGRLPLDLSGLTDFQASVLQAATTIPAGQVRPYGWVAREIGNPGAVRAVGSALARNPVPVVVPCHRVVRADGLLGEYSLGDARNKRVLLEAEGLDVDAYEDDARAGLRFVGSDTTGIFCHPTCGHARRITTPHRVALKSEREAATAGFRPCAVCRPVAA